MPHRQPAAARCRPRHLQYRELNRQTNHHPLGVRAAGFPRCSGGRLREWRFHLLVSWSNPQSGDDILGRLTRTTLAGYRPPGINIVKDESVLLIKLKNSWRF